MLPIWMKVRGQLTSSLLPLWWVPGIRLRLGSKYPGLVNHFAGPEGFIHYVCLYLRRLKEGIGSTELELQVIVSCPTWVLGAQLGIFAKAVYTLPPAPDLFFLFLTPSLCLCGPIRCSFVYSSIIRRQLPSSLRSLSTSVLLKPVCRTHLSNWHQLSELKMASFLCHWYLRIFEESFKIP